jgi:hypothetical protein
MISATAALREEVPALLRGAPDRPVSWDVPREAEAPSPSP